ncbi:MAG: zinc-binding dehydrogenase [Clostridia bacterium]|nr:zinc-binding dehydrogenase [Clostridia bacterium]
MQSPTIVFTKKDTAELIPLDIRPVGEYDVLVEVAYTTISNGTERANVGGDPNVSVYDNNTEAHFPRICGYSAAGIVKEVGSGVTTVKPGDRVVGAWGKHTKYSVLPEKNVHLIESEKTSLQAASMALIGTFPMSALRKCRLEFGESGMVMGLGILGQIAIQLLRAAGAVPVIAVDPVAEKREIALKLGADYAFDPTEEGFAQKVKEVTHGGVNVCVEVTGVARALDNALDCMARMGRVALLGCTRHSDFMIDYYHKVHGPGIVLIGAHTMARPKVESSAGLWTDHDDIMALLRLHGAGRLNLEDLICEVHSPAECGEVFHRLVYEKNFPVVQFDWSRI